MTDDADITVVDAADKRQFELHVDGELASLSTYRLSGDVIGFLHTETLEGFSGRGLATRLIRAELDVARQRGLSVRPHCPFVREFIANNSDYLDLVRETDRERFDL